MQPLRYVINLTLDGCCDHRAGQTDAELHGYRAEQLTQADALILGRVTYEIMQAAWRPPENGLRPGWMRDWMEPFARSIDKAKYVDMKLINQREFSSGAVALKYEP